MEQISALASSVEPGPGAAATLEPEAILPCQFFSRTQVDASLQPEKRLMLAVLEDAVGTFQKHVSARDRASQRVYAQVEEWFASADVEWPYSFVNVCQGLGLDADYLRIGLRRWREKQWSTPEGGARVLRFPFRRVNGTRHAVSGRPVGLPRTG